MFRHHRQPRPFHTDCSEGLHQLQAYGHQSVRVSVQRRGSRKQRVRVLSCNHHRNCNQIHCTISSTIDNKKLADACLFMTYFLSASSTRRGSWSFTRGCSALPSSSSRAHQLSRTRMRNGRLDSCLSVFQRTDRRPTTLLDTVICTPTSTTRTKSACASGKSSFCNLEFTWFISLSFDD